MLALEQGNLCAEPLLQAAQCCCQSDCPAGHHCGGRQFGGLAPYLSPAGQVIKRAVVGCCPTLHLPAGKHWLLNAFLRWPLGQRDQLAWQPSAQSVKLHGLIDADCSSRDESGRTGEPWVVIT